MIRSARRAGPRRLLSLLGSGLILAGLLPASAAPVAAASSTVVISEFRVRGPNGGNDEFIELYNLSASPVSIGGLLIRGSNNAAGVSTRATITPGTTINAGCHYLLTNSTVSAGPYGGSVTGDQTYTVGIADDGGIALTQADGTTIVDAVGMSTGSAYKEGNPLANLGTTNLDRGYERKPGGAAGSGQDTDDNASDFAVLTPSQPQNSASTCTGGDAAPFVSSTTPANGATGVAINTTPTVTFSENVTLTAVTLQCDDQGIKPVTVTGGSLTFSLETAQFQNDDHCAVTIPGTAVSDADGNDPPDNMAADYTWSFDTAVGVVGTQVVINEIDYDQPGADIAEFIELKNVSDDVVSLDPYNVLIINGATGTIARTIDLPTTAVLAPEAYYVICANNATVVNCDLDVSPDTNLIENGEPDAVGLRRGGLSGTLVDTVSYEGNTAAPYTEGSGVGLIDDGVAAADGISRCPDGTDTNVNNVDFQTRTITPGGSNSCPGDEDTAPAVATTVPANGATGVAVGANVSITFSEDVVAAGTWFTIVCGSSGSHTATAGGGLTTYVIDPDADFATGETCTVTILAAQVTDVDVADPPDEMDDDYVFTFSTETAPVAIHDIQGATHTSVFAGQTLAASGVVTARSSNGFWIQEPDATVDTDDATSEAIFVFTSSAPTVSVGDAVQVSGTVSEFRPGGAASTNLTTTEIAGPTISVVSTGNPLPAATVIGAGGRAQPTEVIEDDASGSVETSGVFDPASDGIDFYESLEGMRVQVNNPVVVGPTSGFGETWVLPDGGAGAGTRTNRGGIVVRSGDFNPERIQFDDTLVPLPPLNVGDGYGGPVVGVVDYNFGNFEVLPTATPTGVDNGLVREATPVNNHPDTISIGTFNVENLDPGDPDSKFQELASLIVNNLRSPDLLSLEEIQDNNGAINNGVVDASATLNELIAAIQAEGGPAYEFRQINPVNNADGGEPGGNIRVGFLFRTDRGLAFVDRPGGNATTPTAVVDNGGEPELSLSPGRIDPTNSAFNSSRKPLAGEFTFNGHHFFAVTNHFNSKGGDQPLFGRFQPPALVSETQRLQQAAIVNDFADDILAVDPNAEIVVLGDLNDFEFSAPVQTLAGSPRVLTPLMESLPQDQRYSYVFEGNSQSLDHIVFSDGLLALPFTFDVVHVNAEFSAQASDHDPQVVTVELGCQFATSGTTMTLLTDCVTDSTIHVPNGWTLDGDGHTITGVDPDNGHFVGAVIANAGAVAHVTDVTVTVSGLANVCDDGANRLRGILFDGAAGSITASHAIDINQGASGCQEGNAIEVRNAPFDTTGPDVAVSVSNNVVTGYQKTGILANGSVQATITGNTVTGAGPVNYIAQNGVQVGFGGGGLVRGNTISGNSYTGPDLACGILFVDADGVKQQANTLIANERDVCNFGRGGGNSKPAK